MAKLKLLALGAVIFVSNAAFAEQDDIPESGNFVAQFQSTYLWQRKPAFNSATTPVDPPRSLLAEKEPRSYTFTTTAYLGVRPWRGAEVFYNPEMSMGQAMSGLAGLGGLSNGENQKGASSTPIFYTARFFLRQTWNFGELSEDVEARFNQFAGKASKERVVLTLGKIAVSDIFDNNAFAHDPRSQFFNWALMANGAYDYAADARGYTSGIAAEYFMNDWEFRLGRFKMPIQSNGLEIDEKLTHHFGDQVEVAHNHEIDGLKGALRALWFRNHIVTGNYLDAVAANPGAAELAPVRRLQNKIGVTLNMDQMLTENLGVFGKFSKNDGKTETYAFAEIDRSASAGISLKGAAWGRGDDNVAVAYVVNNLSNDHKVFLANSGAGVFIGGWPQSSYKAEKIIESYYNAKLNKFAWLSFDFQHVANPGYNPDRGPVRIFGTRLHLEY